MKHGVESRSRVSLVSKLVGQGRWHVPPCVFIAIAQTVGA